MAFTTYYLQLDLLLSKKEQGWKIREVGDACPEGKMCQWGKHLRYQRIMHNTTILNPPTRVPPGCYSHVDHSDYWTDMIMKATTQRKGRFKAISSAWLLIISELPACITDKPWCWLQSPSIIKRICAMKAARDLKSLYSGETKRNGPLSNGDK